MTDLNKEREEFESDLADHLIERDSNGFYLNDEIQNYWEKHLLKVQIKVLKAELEKAKAQAVPEWISVEDCLPDEGDLVLGISKTKLAKFNVYQVVALDEFEECEINYWMPLPTVPSESGAEG
ncbi:DUF551 domain-containing protein [Acinetobacter baumannii]|uniref:DUF551 domain-containing protein n=1 Tax=Acinetobacter baumannii TaxID=470 RepID=UPI000AAF926C|nr:DUF551 domain-containing protein [Acinetobacter baumannii]